MSDQPMTAQERNALLGGILGDALIDRLLEPVATGRDPMSGATFYGSSPMTNVVQAVWTQRQQQIIAAVAEKLDVDALVDLIVGKVSDQIVSELTKPGTTYNPSPSDKKIRDRVLEIVAQQLGRRVVDQMDLQIGPKQVGA